MPRSFFNRFALLMSEAGDPSAGGGDPTPPATPPTTPPATPAAPTYFNQDGTFGENWHLGLGDEFSTHAAQLGTFKDVKGLAKSYLHLRAHGPAYPEDSATPEDIQRFHALAKVPVEGTPTAYGIQIPENASDTDKALLDRIAKVAHENHLSGPGFAKVVAEFQTAQAEINATLQSQFEAQQKAAQDELVAAWRGDFEANKSVVRHLTTKLAESAGIAPEQAEALAGNPAFAKIMLQVSKLTAEDSNRIPSGIGDLRAPAQRAQAIMDGTDPEWGKKYTDGTTEERMAAYKVVAGLLQQQAK